MAAIQQSINQLLYSANIGAGFYSQSPHAKRKYEEKTAKEEGEKRAVAYSTVLNETMAALGKDKKDIWTKEDFTPETFKMVKDYHSSNQRAASKAFYANPTPDNLKELLKTREASQAVKDLEKEWFPKPKKAKGQIKAEKAGAEALETTTATKTHMANVRKEEANNG